MHHGLANALMIDTVMEWNLEAAPAKFAEMAHVVGARDGADFVNWLRQLKQRIGITGSLSSHGVTADHLPRLVPLAAQDFTGGTNPRPASAQDYERLFRQAL